jgi:hydroxymethylpyrimidine pyrophosphatase-like HAD family hydrolase
MTINYESKKRPPILAVDFDGTITEQASFADFKPNSHPREYAIKVLNQLYHEGCYIIIWTCRAEVVQGDMITFLDKWGIPYDKINENVDGLPFKTSQKIVADFYIDNKSIGNLMEWEEVYDRVHLEFEDYFNSIQDKIKTSKLPKNPTDETLIKMWQELGNIPTNNEEIILKPFYEWGIETNKYRIWDWFDEHYSKGDITKLHSEAMQKMIGA